MPKTAAKKPIKTKTTPYDVAEHLRTPEEMAAYLDAWIEEAPNDAPGIARALGEIGRAEDAEDLAAFAARAKEPSLAFEDVLGDLKRRGKP